MSNYSRMTLWSAERANVLSLKHACMHARTRTNEYSLIGLSLLCACPCVYQDDHHPLITSYMLETISESAPVVGQSQALQTYRPSIREASITTA